MSLLSKIKSYFGIRDYNAEMRELSDHIEKRAAELKKRNVLLANEAIRTSNYFNDVLHKKRYNMSAVVCGSPAQLDELEKVLRKGQISYECDPYHHFIVINPNLSTKSYKRIQSHGGLIAICNKRSIIKIDTNRLDKEPLLRFVITSPTEVEIYLENCGPQFRTSDGHVDVEKYYIENKKAYMMFEKQMDLAFAKKIMIHGTKGQLKCISDYLTSHRVPNSVFHCARGNNVLDITLTHKSHTRLLNNCGGIEKVCTMHKVKQTAYASHDIPIYKNLGPDKDDQTHIVISKGACEYSISVW